MTRGQRLREAINWINASTLTGLLIARTGRAEVARQPDGIRTATRYRGVGPRRTFTVGNVLLTRHSAAELQNRPELLSHESRHSTQWALLGPLFVPCYYIEVLISLLLTGDDAAANVFEVAADLEAGGYACRPLQRRATQARS